MSFPAPAEDWLVAQRVLLPLHDPSVLALYARGRIEGYERQGLTVPARSEARFDTYFGAFPALSWQRTTGTSRVRLRLRITGTATIVVLSTDTAGQTTEYHRIEHASGAVDIELALRKNASWLWFEVETADESASVSDMTWSIPHGPVGPGVATLSITTFNREDDLVALLDCVASDERLLALVGRVVVVDQGTRQVAAHAGFPAAAASLGHRMQLIRQANLGGSGGFSRGMLAAADEDDTQVVVLLDDDVLLEPESAVRLILMTCTARGATIVGAHMLSLTDRTRLHSWGERVDRRHFWWTPADPRLVDLDLSETELRRDAALSADTAIDFNGWWMCAIPRVAVRRLGAALPFFIKWDDAEYGLRASAAGIPTVSLPGAALWHMPWTGKDNAFDWQVYFHHRNRLVTALVHGPRRAPIRMLLHTFAEDVNHLLCLRYGSVAVRLLAVRDVLSGPDHLVETLATRRETARRLLDQHGQSLISPDAHRADATRPGATQPRPRSAPAALAMVLMHQLKRPRTAETVLLESEQGKWAIVGRLDSIILASATGSGHYLLTRERRKALRLLGRSLSLHLRLATRWTGLASRYARAAPGLAAKPTWDRIVEETSAGQ